VTYSSKILQADFSLASGNFQSGSGSGNNLSVSGLRMSAHIKVTGGAALSEVDLTIFGMSLSQMNQLTTFGTNFLSYNKNGLTIQAGDESGMTLVFQGIIRTCYVDAQSQPQVCLRVHAGVGDYHNVAPQVPISFRGPTPAATIAKKIAGYMGYGFIDNGVKTILNNPYYSSDAVTMMRRLGEHANFDWHIDCGNVTITPPGGSNGDEVPLISPQTGMVGYPVFNSQQLVVKTQFGVPVVKREQKVQIQSDITPACGVWTVYL
jgi:hypothetical protein